MIYVNATFSSKLDTFESEKCAVNKVIRLSAAEYDRFSGNMLRDQYFIKDNLDLMRYDNGTRGCLLVIGEGRRDGILVDSSGHDYARYTAFIPNANALLTVGQCRALAWLNEKLTEIVEYISGLDGERIAINIGEMDFMFGIDMARNPTLVSTVMGMLGDIPGIGEMEFDKSVLVIHREPNQHEDLSDVPDENKNTGKALRRLRHQPTDRSPEEKTSVMGRIRETRKTTPAPRKQKDEHGKGGPAL